MSVVGLLAWADVSESNYLPFLVGANVLLNDFPANPTTWYIGTYLHLLILWAVVLRGLPVTGRMLLLAAIGEILVRAILIGFAGLFPAYMLFSNWLTVLLLGLWAGQHRGRPAGRRALFSAVLFLLVYPILANTFSWRRTFPLMTLSGTSPLDQLTTALFVTTVYVGFTGAAFCTDLASTALSNGWLSGQKHGLCLYRSYARVLPAGVPCYCPSFRAIRSE